jgi:hypothetical protein
MFRHVESKLVLLGEAIDIHNELPSMTYKMNDYMNDGYFSKKFMLVVD